MSQKPKKQKTGQHGPGGSSRPSTSRQQDEPEDMDYEDMTQGTQTQGSSMKQARKQFEKMDQRMQEKKVSEVVRYLLCAEGRKVPVKRKELNDKVLCGHSRALPVILELANEQLTEVFGLEAREIVRGKTKSIILVNKLPSTMTEGLFQRSKLDKAHLGLLSVILSLIMMKQGKITDDQLWSCLGRLGISRDGAIHRDFGDAEKLISKEYVEQMYLDRERQVAGDGYAVWYRWGPRAVEEVDRTQLLKFIADVYGANLPAWERHFGSMSGSHGTVESTQE